jgi:hypothetical protein
VRHAVARFEWAGVPGPRCRCGCRLSGDKRRRLSFTDIHRIRLARVRVSGRGISELGHGVETNIVSGSITLFEVCGVRGMLSFAQDAVQTVRVEISLTCVAQVVFQRDART